MRAASRGHAAEEESLRAIVAASLSIAGLAAGAAALLYLRLRDAREEVGRSQNRLRALFAAVPFPLVVTRVRDGTIVHANTAAIDLYGLGSESRAQGFRAASLFADPSIRPRILEKLDRDGAVENLEVEVRTPAGKQLWLLYSARLIELAGESCILTSQADITDRKRAQQELERFAATDPLTGAANRRAGLVVLEKAMRLAERDLTPLSICFADVDDLKVVNDRFGHGEGDELIARVADAIARCLRESDTLCRLGGDEFLVVLPRCDTAGAEELWSRVEAAIADLERRAPKPYPVSVSHGFAEYPLEGGPTSDEFIALADAAMYRRKSASP